MLGRTRVALKFLTYGVVVGVLFAPRSGAETRAQVLDWAKSSVTGFLGELGIGGGTAGS